MEKKPSIKKKWKSPEVSLLARNVNGPNDKNINRGHESTFRSHASVRIGKSTVPYAYFNDGHKVRIGNGVTAKYFTEGS